ncbi:unnamed protein product [Rhizoctonia solani]|uniref:Ricin B lectin domain-containing protein n=1 Tax=Rhizoctonia solani TaxID=456999 RepID=A0A8H3B5H0_9AGAM|nr:unnamed protein product [Rhizoctonia solani]
MSTFSGVGVYRIKNAQSGTVMTMVDPQRPIVCAETGVRDRRSLWRCTLQPNGGYRLTNVRYGLQARIDNYNDTSLVGSQHGGHIWSIRKGTGYEYTIHSGVGGYVAGLTKPDDESDDSVQVSRDTTAKHQRWFIEQASEPETGDPDARPGVHVIKSAKTGTVLGVEGGSGDGVFAYESNGSSGQKVGIIHVPLIQESADAIVV